LRTVIDDTESPRRLFNYKYTVGRSCTFFREFGSFTTDEMACNKSLEMRELFPKALFQFRKITHIWYLLLSLSLFPKFRVTYFRRDVAENVKH
jgi:hypothetical protein